MDFLAPETVIALSGLAGFVALTTIRDLVPADLLAGVFFAAVVLFVLFALPRAALLLLLSLPRADLQLLFVPPRAAHVLQELAVFLPAVEIVILVTIVPFVTVVAEVVVVVVAVMTALTHPPQIKKRCAVTDQNTLHVSFSVSDPPISQSRQKQRTVPNQMHQPEKQSAQGV